MLYIIFILVLALAITVYQFFKLYWVCCDDIPELNENYIVQSLSPIVFGQEVALGIVALALQTYMTKLKAGIYKPLILSFHGSSGVGKTLLSSQISYFLPANTRVLRLHPSQFYTRKIESIEQVTLNWFLQNASWFSWCSWCSWNIVIVEHAEELTEEFQESFKKLFSSQKDIWQKRKLIVIFESNLYYSEINNVVFDKVNYQEQNTFHKSDFKPIFLRDPSNWLVKMYQKDILDAFVPFMPLDKNNVAKCIEQEMKQTNLIPYKDIVKEIANEIFLHTFEGKGFQYSITGCKMVADEVSMWFRSPQSNL